MPDLELAGLANGTPLASAGARRSSLHIGVSVAIHTLVVGTLLTVPLLRDTPLPDPTQSVRAFFVTPSFASPPPPPPPAPAVKRASPVTPAAQTVGPSAFVAPSQIPNSVDAHEEVDLGVPGDTVGGVQGGVAGGVIGGVVGGLGAAAPVTTPLRVGSGISEPRKIKNVDPTYPSVARAARIQGAVVIECVIGTDGRVTDTKVVQGQPLLDGAALKAVQQWRYTPTLYQGTPVPVILTVTVTFRLA
jgi:protein TonB